MTRDRNKSLSHSDEERSILEALRSLVKPPAADGPADAMTKKLVLGSNRVPTAPPLSSIAMVAGYQAASPVTVGTAFFCDPDALVTVKHTFAVPVNQAGVFIAYDGVTNPTPAAARVIAIDLHKDLDLAVLIVETAPQAPLVLGGVALAPHTPLELTGYGFTYKNGTRMMSSGRGAVKNVSASQIDYAISTDGGDSGAPLYVRDSAGKLRVAAMHVTGDGVSSTNGGLPMTPPVVAQVMLCLQRARSKVSH